METMDKIEMLGGAAQFDLCGQACGTQAQRVRDDIGRWIYPAAMPDGRRISLLKVLMTNACENDCGYCAQRAGRDCRRSRFLPDELAKLFEELWRAKRVEGIFLSSSIVGGGDHSMEPMIDTIELIRRKVGFSGYVHLKVLPGAQRAAIERAVQLADRVSLNLEAPSAERLARLAPGKDFAGELLSRLRWTAGEVQRVTADGRRKVGGGRAGVTTQFVVGAADESDKEVLGTSARLYDELRLQRAYYSAFQPVSDTPLESLTPTPAWREHRLYQSDWLLRFYGFRFSELIFDPSGNLPREADPKEMWAKAHPERFPIEVNRATQRDLLRIPGIGPRSARRIVDLRRDNKLRELTDLTKLGVVTNRAAPYVLLNGRRPPVQLGLW